MNWLAHAYLSKPNIEFRVGNILPDLVSITELKHFAPAFQEGIRCHQSIDIFTDSHPIVRAGIHRLPAGYKRYGGILTDVFYDHFLARDWHLYSTVSLKEFTRDFYGSLDIIEGKVPPEIIQLFKRMLEHHIFESYQTTAGVKTALQRIDMRLKRPANLGAAVVILEDNYSVYEAEFSAFFAQLQTHVQPHIRNL